MRYNQVYFFAGFEFIVFDRILDSLRLIVMQFFETYKDLPEEARGCVIVIGNFDGVHLGHQALLHKARLIAQEEGRKVGVLTFDPHPRQLFRSDEPLCRITSQDIKKERLAACGVDCLFSILFDWDFASQPAEDFIKNVLVEGLAASHIIVGADFKFGQLRKGTAQTIIDAGLPVSVIEKVKDGESRDFSSSNVRSCLRHGKVEEASHVLGWPWEVRSTIIKGDQRGRELGYPTANMELGDIIHPAYGVYACRAQIMGEDKWYGGACNIGIRPMFEVTTALVETYIFDFDRDIYGETLCLRPVKRLRGEAKFDSLDELIEQMGKDCEQSRIILNQNSFKD